MSFRRVLHTVAPAAALLSGQACSGTPPNLTSLNEPPSVAVVEGVGDAAPVEGDAVTFEARVYDADDIAEALSVTWVSDLQGRLGEPVQPDSEGLATLRSPALVAGEHRVSVTVADRQGATGSVSFTLQVAVSNPPIAALDEGVEDGIYYDEIAILVHGLLSDPETEPADLTAWWTVDGVETPTVPDDLGNVWLKMAPLAEGWHALALWVRDAAGLTDSASVSLRVRECADYDGDGFDCHSDCDDTEADRFPGQQEQCNGVDDDCDGAADEGFDPDGDGVPNCD